MSSRMVKDGRFNSQSGYLLTVPSLSDSRQLKMLVCMTMLMYCNWYSSNQGICYSIRASATSLNTLHTLHMTWNLLGNHLTKVQMAAGGEKVNRTQRGWEFVKDHTSSLFCSRTHSCGTFLVDSKQQCLCCCTASSISQGQVRWARTMCDIVVWSINNRQIKLCLPAGTVPLNIFMATSQ